MIFTQLFEPESSTYTYVIGCPETRRAILVDPVLETVERDLRVLEDLGLTLEKTLDTHVHADHLTSALKLRALVDSTICAPARAGVSCADVHVSPEAPVTVGTVAVHALFTPGHTDHHLSYVVSGAEWDAVMTGDCLLIDGCGRTDFQGGSSAELYRSVRETLFALKDDTLVYPGHDYQGRRVSSIGQEKARNPRLGDGIDEARFADIMANLNLPYPKKMDAAVPANLLCGQCPDTVPEHLKRLCDPAPQG